MTCHRVIGANGNPTGYSGRRRNKIALLRSEANNFI
ncbi:MAG: MGMT family protein [Bacteroidales bacterium]|nr:MGMT family protein [Bacteroidales bacterium]